MHNPICRAVQRETEAGSERSRQGENQGLKITGIAIATVKIERVPLHVRGQSQRPVYFQGCLKRQIEMIPTKLGEDTRPVQAPQINMAVGLGGWGKDLSYAHHSLVRPLVFFSVSRSRPSLVIY
jgi:hypothetical protein